MADWNVVVEGRFRNFDEQIDEGRVLQTVDATM